MPAEAARTRDPQALCEHLVYDILVAPTPRSRHLMAVARAGQESVKFCAFRLAGRRWCRRTDVDMEDRRGGAVR